MEEVLFGRIRMTIPDAQFRVSTDSMVLADFCRDAGGRGLDLGCGCGTLGLLLLGSGAAGSVCGIEIQPEAARQAEENAWRNGLADRFSVVCGDLRQAHAQIPAGSFDFAVSNPPYYPPGSGRLRKEDSLSLARSELCCPLDALCAAAARALRWGGRLYLVHKPERLADLMVFLRAARLEPKRLRFVRHSAASAVSLVLLEARLGESRGCRSSRSWSSTGRTAASLPRADAFTTDRSETDMAGMLYLVPTPIGNLSDISPRCRQTLAEADFIAAEDTRVSLKLLNHLELKKSLVSYHEHNKAESGEKILARLLAGETCALVTDAGSPAISDPGEDLVRLCAEHGVTVCAIPGPCALVTALSISGLPTGRFTFEGFLSVNKKSRQEHLTGLKDETRTMIFYEAPHKLLATLQDLSAAFGAERKISLCRELTKLHEEVRRTTLGEAAAYYAENPPRGEFVLVVAGAEEPAEEGCTFEGALALVRARMDEGLSTKDAVKQVAKLTGFAKNQLYDAILKG